MLAGQTAATKTSKEVDTLERDSNVSNGAAIMNSGTSNHSVIYG